MNSQRIPGSQLQNESTPFHIVLTFIGSPGVGTPGISQETHPPQSPLFICCHNFIHQSCPSATIRRRGEHEMVGLSVILESSKDRSEKMIRRRPQVHVSKGTMIRPVALNDSPSSSSSSSSFNGVSTKTPTCGFLERCFLCKQKLLSGKDIYMYRGDKAFCSEECRSRQIFMDEEEQAKSCCTREYNCCTTASTCARRGKGTRDLGNASVF